MLLTYIRNKPHERVSKLLPRFVLRPDEQYARDNSGYEVVKPPPALDPRTVYFEDTLANSQRAIVPYQ